MCGTTGPTTAPTRAIPCRRSAGSPTGLAVWAEHMRAPLLVCSDARLEAGANRVLAYPDRTSHGQGGWQMGVSRGSALKGLAGASSSVRSLPRSTVTTVRGQQPPSALVRSPVWRSTPRFPRVVRCRRSAPRRQAAVVVHPARSQAPPRAHARMLKRARRSSCSAATSLAATPATPSSSHCRSSGPATPVTASQTIGYAESGEQRRRKRATTQAVRVTDQIDAFSSDRFQEQKLEDEHFSPIWEDLNALHGVTSKPHAPPQDGARRTDRVPRPHRLTSR